MLLEAPQQNALVFQHFRVQQARVPKPDFLGFSAAVRGPVCNLCRNFRRELVNNPLPYGGFFERKPFMKI